MIGKLQGQVDYVCEDFAIIMVGGVGYRVYCPEYLTLGTSVTLWIETVVREDSIRLFAFTSTVQTDLFNKLTTVPGVGPKLAMSVLSAFKPDVLISAIITSDSKTLTSAPGVGKKMSEKIILELKDKLSSTAFNFDLDMSASGITSHLTDLLYALESLGYRRVDIVEVAQKLVKENPDLSVEKLLPLALKKITQG